MDHLNPRSPLVFDTTDLGRRPGSMEQVQRTVEAPADFGTDVIAVPAGLPDRAGAAARVRRRGRAGHRLGARHGNRRLRAVPGPRRPRGRRALPGAVRLRRSRGPPPRGGRRTTTRPTSTPLEGDLFDLEPVLRDAVVPALPFQPVCRDDCPGLCSECGAHLADDPQHHHDVIDPRWSALSALSSVDMTGAPPQQHRTRRGTDVAVPKRKTSRSNTRSRRANWKTTRDHADHLPAVQGPDAAAPCLPVVRLLQGPSLHAGRAHRAPGLSTPVRA